MRLAAPVVPFAASFPRDRALDELGAIASASWRPATRLDPGGAVVRLALVENGEAEALGALPAVSAWLASLDAPLLRAEIRSFPARTRTAVRVDAGRESRDHLSLHVPLSAGFELEGADGRLPLSAGAGYAIDTWRPHRLANVADSTGLLLHVESAGSAALSERLGRTHRGPAFDLPAAAAGSPRLERHPLALPDPWELQAAIGWVLGEVAGAPVGGELQRAFARLTQAWRGIWAAGAEACNEAGPALARSTREAVLAAGGERIGLRNGLGLMPVLDAQVFEPMRGSADAVAATQRSPHSRGNPDAATDPYFDRPVFIVSLPRSGSTMLFELLAQARDAYTIGDESHALIEGIAGLAPADRAFESNRLGRDDASPNVAASLRERFLDNLRDRDGHRSDGASRLRMVEKTPKNALRIPFLSTVFPDARFVYLHRDPREVLASMIESWTSGRFVTYPDLPGWSGPPWSLLLVPGWRESSGTPLADIVGQQWATTSQILLDDLGGMPSTHRLDVDYATLLQDPDAAMARICDWAGLDRDRTVDGSLPLSRYTLSRPQRDKWRRHEAAVEAQLERWSEVAARVARVAASIPV